MELLNVKEVSKLLRVSESWIRAHTPGPKHTMQPHIPCVRMGRRILYARQDIHDWVEKLKEAQQSQRKTA